VRGYAKKYFALTSLPKAKNVGITKLDADKMKQRTSWTLKIRTNGAFDEFKGHLTAVLEHHFDDHKDCAD
jgi:hypothetical protein